MAEIKPMIVVENVFEKMFSYLPEMKFEESGPAYEPRFGSGTKKELNIFLKNNKNPYPLIWLLYPYIEKHSSNKAEINNATLILAVTTNSSMQNDQRLNETYAKVLFPLFDNIRHCIKMANVINSDQIFSVVKYPNYSDEEATDGSHAVVAIWDALKVNFGLTILNTCLKPIKFTS